MSYYLEDLYPIENRPCCFVRCSAGTPFLIAKVSIRTAIRYRRSGKTLITFYPKKDELTVLIIFGKKEVEKFEKSKDEFSPEIVELFENTKQYHDGRWLHIKAPPFKNFEDIKKLLHIKRRTKKAP